jgi:hypothetical protein
VASTYCGSISRYPWQYETSFDVPAVFVVVEVQVVAIALAFGDNKVRRLRVSRIWNVEARVAIARPPGTVRRSDTLASATLLLPEVELPGIDFGQDWLEHWYERGQVGQSCSGLHTSRLVGCNRCGIVRSL